MDVVTGSGEPGVRRKQRRTTVWGAERAKKAAVAITRDHGSPPRILKGFQL